MANFNFNKVILGGRLTSDVELKTTPNGTQVATFSIAVNRQYSKDKEQQTDFINVTAWRGTAEFICKYFKKASSICIIGSIQTRSWTDNNGQKRYATEVVADEAYFVDAKGESSAPQNAYAPVSQYVPEQYKAPSEPKYEEITDEDELPF